MKTKIHLVINESIFSKIFAQSKFFSTKFVVFGFVFIVLAGIVNAQNGIKTVNLAKLTANSTSEIGADEVYFIVIADGVTHRVPEKGSISLTKGSSWENIGKFDIKNTVIVFVWEEDDASKDDLIGNVPPIILSLNPKGKTYTFTYEGNYELKLDIANQTTAPYPFPLFNENDQEGRSTVAVSSSLAATVGGQSPSDWLASVAKNWISYLPDTTKLKEMSIPATHDSGALHGGVGAQTQVWTIDEQLNAGIRYLDIRLYSRDGKTLDLYHGDFTQHTTFDEVMIIIKKFLDDNPKECLIMNIQLEENDATDAEKRNFSSAWTLSKVKYGNYFSPQSASPDLTLGNLRGKVLLIGSVIGPSKLALHTNNKSDIGSFEGKKSDIETTLTLAVSGKDPKLVFTDLADYWIAPLDVALTTNPYAYDQMKILSDKNPNRVVKFGIVSMDFPGDKLIYRIIKSNFSKL